MRPLAASSVVTPVLILSGHNWLRFLVASALVLVLPSADPDQEWPCLAQVLPARDQAWLDPSQESLDPYPEWLCPAPFVPFSTLCSYCQDLNTTRLFVASGTSTVAYSWTESLFLLEAWSEVGILPHHIPCRYPNQGVSQSHALSGLHPHFRIAIWSAPGLRLRPKCIPPSTWFPSLTPCIHLVLPVAGWRSTSPPVSHPLLYSRGASSACIARHVRLFERCWLRLPEAIRHRYSTFKRSRVSTNSRSTFPKPTQEVPFPNQL